MLIKVQRERGLLQLGQDGSTKDEGGQRTRRSLELAFIVYCMFGTLELCLRAWMSGRRRERRGGRVGRDAGAVEGKVDVIAIFIQELTGVREACLRW